MRYAITFREHVGPIQSSLSMCAADRGIDVLVTDPRNMNVAPKGHNWDDYDTLIWFNNKPPTVETSAKVFWWMCDLRAPHTLGGTTTASYIGVCNKMFLGEYESFYKAPAFYVPQCGNDTPVEKGRDMNCDVLFLGHTGRPAIFERLVQTQEITRQQILDKQFHWNRVPVIQSLQNAGMSVKIISREGATVDSKWLHQQTPINLSISLPAEGYTSNRMYNILSSEGFCLVSWFPGLEDLFENHKHLVWFATYGEAVEMAKFYLHRPKERDKIRRAGYTEYVAKHTAANRVVTMLRAML